MRVERGIGVYIINDENQVLLLKHKKLNVWLPPGGHVEGDELTHEAAIREVREETGLEIEFIIDSIPLFKDIFQTEKLDRFAEQLPQPFAVHAEHVSDHIHESLFYLAKPITSEIINNENHDIKWFDFNDINEKNVLGQVIRHIGDIRTMLGI